MRILLDESLPRKFALELTGHETQTVQKRGWAGLENGELLETLRPLVPRVLEVLKTIRPGQLLRVGD